MMIRLTPAAALLGVLVSAPAFAEESTIQPPTAPPAAAAELQRSTPAAARFTAGVQLELLPYGKLDVAALGMHQGGDLVTAFGLGGLFAFDLTPNFSLGAAPRVVFHVATPEGQADASEYDLRARAAVHGEVLPALSLYAFAEPGYSWVDFDQGQDPSGFITAFGGGLSYDISTGAFLSAEVGYQLGFQGFSAQGADVDTHFDYLHLGVAGGARF
jgi:hypothetical protein